MLNLCCPIQPDVLPLSVTGAEVFKGGEGQRASTVVSAGELLLTFQSLCWQFQELQTWIFSFLFIIQAVESYPAVSIFGEFKYLKTEEGRKVNSLQRNEVQKEATSV